MYKGQGQGKSKGYKGKGKRKGMKGRREGQGCPICGDPSQKAKGKMSAVTEDENHQENQQGDWSGLESGC